MDVYAAFKQRTDALRLTTYLKNIRIVSTVINTPNQSGGGCGLSVLFCKYHLESVKQIIRDRNLKSFYGVFAK
jgi:hypothetical protein